MDECFVTEVFVAILTFVELTVVVTNAGADSMSEFETVFFKPSPDGTRAAIVEQDDRVAYFYLQHAQPGKPIEGPESLTPESQGGLQACWLRNLVSGPISFQVEDMQRGIPPVLPRLHCAHADGLDPLEEGRLDVIWFEEGNGAAITCDGEIEAIIPPWSGMDGFHGFARHCKSPNQVCWPMPRDPRILNRLDRARSFWKSWNNNNPWPDLQNYLLAKYSAVLGEHTGYYAIDGNRWPPKAIARFEHEQDIVLLTAGVCIRPQAFHDPSLVVPDELRRIEFGMALKRECSDAILEAVLRLMSSVANYPWFAEQWIGIGHTYPFAEAIEFDERDPNWEQISRFSRLIFAPASFSHFDLGSISYQEDPVQMIWLMPIDQKEALALDQVGAKGVLQALAEQGLTSWDPGRESFI